jgi:hypothetical protein
MGDRLRAASRLGWRAVRLEVTLYWALLRWVARRPSVPVGTTPVGYAQLTAPMMGLWIFASALEVPLVHVLVPWEALRIALLVVSIWGLVWMVGVYAALRTYPHLVDEHAMRVRYATMVDLTLPWRAVRELQVDERTLPSTVRILQRVEDDNGRQLHVAVSARTNVTAQLAEPTVVRTAHGDETVVSVSFWVDDARSFVREQRQRLAAPPGSHPSGRGYDANAG